MASGNALFLDTSIQIARFVHGQETKRRIETRLARCTITVTGSLTDCRIIKGLPFLDQAVLSTLAGQKYTPVMYQGHAQSVFYTLKFRFKLP